MLAGWFDNYTDLGTGPISGVGREMFLVKYDSTATQVKWLELLNGPYNQSAASMVIDQSNGDVLLAGNFESTVSVDGSGYMSNGSYDILLVRYGFNGAQLQKKWASAYGSVYSDRIYSIALDINGKYLVAGGAFMSTASFGQTLTSAGGNDMFLLRMAP